MTPVNGSINFRFLPWADEAQRPLMRTNRETRFPDNGEFLLDQEARSPNLGAFQVTP
jgi:hypothetical protein